MVGGVSDEIMGAHDADSVNTTYGMRGDFTKSIIRESGKHAAFAHSCSCTNEKIRQRNKIITRKMLRVPLGNFQLAICHAHLHRRQ